MKHPTEEELIAYHHGEPMKTGIGAHVAACPECRTELARIDALLTALNTLPAPDPGEDYGARVWQQIAPKLPQRRRHWWNLFSSVAPRTNWLAPQRLAAAAGVAVLVLAAFLAGRVTKRPEPTPVADAANVRERVLIMAVGEHLGRSEMVLVELANAEPQNPRQKRVNISGEQRRAEDLLQENRLYRQTALEQGDTALAGVLDELERVLLDVAHSPAQLTTAQLEGMRQRIEARGILFKVRVVSEELQRREKATKPSPAQTGSVKSERNKA